MPTTSSDITNTLSHTVLRLSEVTEAERPVLAAQGRRLPSVLVINEIILTLKQLLFPEFFYNLRS